jgi:hypothetical protein
MCKSTAEVDVHVCLTDEGRLPMTHMLVVTLLLFLCIALILIHAPAWHRRQGMWTLCGDSS